MPEKLTEQQVVVAMEGYQNWSLNGAQLEREFTLDNFVKALEFVNAVGRLAEEADHHPDILIHGWNKVRLTLSTHSAGGLTKSDFALAGRIDRMLKGG